MKKSLTILTAALFFAACSSSTSLPRAERTDINTAGFDSIFVWANARATDELHSCIVVKDDAVIYEHYAPGHGPDEQHICWSASKTFTAISVGFAAQDGLLDVNDPIVKYFSDEELPQERSEWLSKMTIKDLLIMSSGFRDDFIRRTNGNLDPEPTKQQLANPVVFEPGTLFRYNSMNTYLCSVIVSKVTGMKVVDYLKGKLFDPLGITPDTYCWDESVEGYNYGGWGLHITAENFAKAGLFMLHRGNWNGKQLLGESWFDEAMAPQIIQGNGVLNPDDDWQCGYGYQMWRCKKGGAYRFDGAWGQFCVVIPEKSAVVVLFSHARNTVSILDDMWKYIYEAL